MIDFALLDRHPVIVAVAGPNGAGKTTFYYAHLRAAALRFLNADVVARELDLEAYPAKRVVDALRNECVSRRESFVFETVLSDPVGEKVTFLKDAAEAGYTVVLCYIGISSPEVSEQRVSMRVSQGGHDVPTEKLHSRFPRTLMNLANAIRELPCVLVYDNDNLREPYRLVAAFESGRLVKSAETVSAWLRSMRE